MIQNVVQSNYSVQCGDSNTGACCQAVGYFCCIVRYDTSSMLTSVIITRLAVVGHIITVLHAVYVLVYEKNGIVMLTLPTQLVR